MKRAWRDIGVDRRAVRWVLALVVAVGVLIVLTPTLAWADCTIESRNLRMQQRTQEAEEVSRECVEEQPDNPEAWVEHARSLAALERVDEALEVVDEGLDEHEDSRDLKLMRARLLAWKEEFDRAERILEEMPEETYEDPEAMQLRADVALWSEDYEQAVDWYGRYNEASPDNPLALLKRGRAYGEIGERGKAREDLKKSCDIAPDATDACDALENIAQTGHPIFYANAHLGYARVVERLDGWTTKGEVGSEVTEDFSAAVNWEFLHRPFGDERVGDWRFRGSTRYGLDLGLFGRAGGGFSPDPTFSPLWNAYGEVGWQTDLFSLSGRYWHVQFEDAPVEVFNPNGELYLAPFMVEARYFLAFEDGGEQIYNSGFARGFYFFTNLTQVFLGAGLGDKSDFLEPRRLDSQFHWLVTGGARYMLTPNHRLLLSVTQRHDRADFEVYKQTETLLGYEFRF